MINASAWKRKYFCVHLSRETALNCEEKTEKILKQRIAKLNHVLASLRVIALNHILALFETT